MIPTAARSRVVFALPSGSDLPSGGNVYNNELTRELARRLPVDTLEFSDAEARRADGEPGLYLFDSLDLERATALRPSTSQQRTGLVVHHLPSLEPGLPAEHPSLKLEARVLPRFDFFLATSDFTRDWLEQRGGSARSIIVVPPAVRAPSSSLRGYRGPLSALMVANLVPRKGVLPLLELLGEQEPAPYSLRIVGRSDLDPGYAEACRAVLRRSSWLGERVRLEGSLPPERMSRIYESSHLLISLARMETFGMAILEAKAHGLPVLARDGGYVRRHFEGRDAEGLFSSDRALVDQFVDLALHDGPTAALFDRAQRERPSSAYTWETAATDFLGALDGLV